MNDYVVPGAVLSTGEDDTVGRGLAKILGESPLCHILFEWPVCDFWCPCLPEDCTALAGWTQMSSRVILALINDMGKCDTHPFPVEASKPALDHPSLSVFPLL